MIIPVKCFTGGKVIADKYRYYLDEVRKIKARKNIDENKVRMNEMHTMYGDCKKIMSILGWKKKFSIDQSISWILDFWERQLLTNKDFN